MTSIAFRFDVLTLASALLFSSPWTGSAATTTLTFDGIADDTIINTHYTGARYTNPVGGNARPTGSRSLSGVAGRPALLEVATGTAAWYNTFTNLTGAFQMSGSGLASTNYLDRGGATNVAGRYYRVRLAP